jgi:hypothetical protein
VAGLPTPNKTVVLIWNAETKCEIIDYISRRKLMIIWRVNRSTDKTECCINSDSHGGEYEDHCLLDMDNYLLLW